MVVPVCVVLCVSWSCGCRSHWNGCMNVACCVLWGGSRSTKPCVFPCKVAAARDERYLVCAAGAAGVVWFLLCVLQQWLFLCAQFYAFLEFVLADRIGMAAWMLLGAAAACVILLSFAARSRKSYWSGCIQAAIVICQQMFALLALLICLLKIFLKSASKSFFFCFGVEIRSGFGAAIADAVARSSIVVCNSVSADRIGMAAWMLLGAAQYYCLLQLDLVNRIGVAASRLR